MNKPQQNIDFSWCIRYVDDQYWFFDSSGFPHGPFTTYDIAIDELDWYSYNWDIREEIESEL